MRIPLNLPSGERQRDFLDYMNSALRTRTTSYSGSAGRRVDGCFVSTLQGPFTIGTVTIPLSWTLVRSSDNETIEEIVISGSEGAPPESEWQTAVLEFINSVLSATIAARRTTHFRRSFFFYIGTQLDGEYWLPGFRFAPVDPNDDQPLLINAERAIAIDMNIQAIDDMHAYMLSEESAKRIAARLSLLLNHGLYRPDQSVRWGIPFMSTEPVTEGKRYQMGYIPIRKAIVSMPEKGKECPLGKYEGSLTARYRFAGALLSLPKEARRILRSIDSTNPELRIAFDKGARLYQVGAVIGRQFPSAGLAYRVAAIDAISQANGSRAILADFIKKYASPSPDLDSITEYLWGSIRSAHFHGGEFPLGEFSQVRFVEPLMDTRETTQEMLNRYCYDLTREVIVQWMDKELSNNNKGQTDENSEL